MDVLRKKSVRADDQVHFTCGQALHDLSLLFGGEEPGQDLDPNRIRGKPLREHQVVLLGEQCRRAENRHLLAVLNRLEGCPDRHFRLSEPNIPEYETVHGGGALHIGLDISDRFELVQCLFKRERGLQLALPWGVGLIGVTRGQRPLTMKLHHLCSNGGDGLADTSLLIRPVLATHPRNPWGLPAGISLDGGELIHRHVELVSSGIGDDQVIALDSDHRPRDQSLESANAMLEMNDMIALGEILVLLPRRRRDAPCPAMSAASSRDLLLAENRDAEVRGDETLVYPDGNNRRSEIGQRVESIDGQTLICESPGNPVCGRLPIHGDHNGDLSQKQSVQPGRHRFGITCGGVKGGDLEHGVGRARRRRRNAEMTSSPNRVLEIEKQGRMISRLRGCFAPGWRQRRSQLGLLFDQIAAAVQAASRIYEGKVARRLQLIDHAPLVGQPGKPRLDTGEQLTLHDAVPRRGGPGFRPHHVRGALPNSGVRSHLPSRVGDESLDRVQ